MYLKRWLDLAGVEETYGSLLKFLIKDYFLSSVSEDIRIFTKRIVDGLYILQSSGKSETGKALFSDAFRQWALSRKRSNLEEK